MTSRAQRLPRDPEFEARVRASFARQRFMTQLGAQLAAIAPGVVEIELPVAEELVQQNGYLHAGALLAALDSACGYAALTLSQPEPAFSPSSSRRICSHLPGPGLSRLVAR